MSVYGDFARNAALYVIPCKGGPQAVLWRDFAQANCLPSDQTFFQIRPSGLRRTRTFRAVGEVRILPSTAKRGFRILTTPTYKIWWSDVYEWDGHRFVFANRRSPELYRGLWAPDPTDVAEDYVYTLWLRYAARLDVELRWSEAILAWRRAENLLQPEAKQAHADRGPWYGWWGNPVESLREVRQRIRWLLHGDHDHALLYRPYDWDLQVPPYRLGHAGDDR